jgi:hypothetical protein
VALFHAGALGRILRYARSSLPHSLIGGALSSAPWGTRLACLAGILLPLALVTLTLRTYRRHRLSLAPADRVFWPANAIFCYALVLPVFDTELLPRLVLFAPLPALVLMAYHLRWGEGRTRVRVLLAAAALGVVLMAAGEIVNLAMLYPDKGEIHRELLEVKERYRLSERDLVLTTYAVNPICNWFLGTKSGLITAFNRADAKAYARVFVLNPREEAPAALPAGASPGSRVTFPTPEDRARAMRQRIPVADDVPPLVRTGHLEVYLLDGMPENWLFDAGGNWIGYVAEGPGASG